MNNGNKKNPATMFVQPIFEYKSEEWLAMIFGWPEQIKPDSTFLMGIAFKTEKYAHEFFELLRAYNDGESIDVDNNIKVSLITESLNDYSVYIYPSSDRKNVKKFMDESIKKFGKETELVIANLTMCKPFPYGEGSSFKRFKDIYIEGCPIEMRAFTLENGNQPKVIKSIKPIIKNHVKIKHRKSLTKNDPEYHHGKDIMGK